jgi:chaperonin GroEL
VIVGKLLESAEYAYGWNAQTGEYGDLYKWGVIDPAKVVRTAIEEQPRLPACSSRPRR